MRPSLPTTCRAAAPFGSRTRRAIILAAVSLALGHAAEAQSAPAAPPPAAGPTNLAPPGTPPAAGQIQAGQTSWTSQCASDSRTAALQCSVKAEVGVAATGQLLAGFTVNIPSDTHMPAMLIQVPLGLSLPEGVTVNVDGANSQTLPLQTCDSSGCYAGAAIAAKLLIALMGGKTLTVAFVGINKQAITLPFNLAGFAAAYQKVK